MPLKNWNSCIKQMTNDRNKMVEYTDFMMAASRKLAIINQDNI